MNRIAISIGVTIIVLLAGCNHKEHKQEENSHFQVTSPVQKDTTVFTEYVCQISAINHIELRSQERGYLQEIFVDEGQL